MGHTTSFWIAATLLAAASLAPAQDLPPYPLSLPHPVLRDTAPPPRETSVTLQPYAQAEFLLWWLSDRSLPPLVSTSASQPSLGVLGRPDTQVLYGGTVDGDLRPGGRFTLGLDGLAVHRGGEPLPFGVETTFFFLDEHNNPFVAATTGNPVLARPFLDARTERPFSDLAAYQPPGGPSPRGFPAFVAIDNRSRVWGAEAHGTWDAVRGVPNLRVRGLAGFRHLGLEESLRLRQDLALPAAGGLPEMSLTVHDAFRTRNYFYGGQLGFRAHYQVGAVSAELVSKLALGGIDQAADVHGSRVLAARNPATGAYLVPRVSLGGLLTGPTNVGRYSRTRFAIIPETSVNLGFDVAEGVRFFVGYNFLYVSSVLRPGDQIGTVADVRGRDGGPTDANHPEFTFRGSDFWLQGIQFGLDLRY